MLVFDRLTEVTFGKTNQYYNIFSVMLVSCRFSIDAQRGAVFAEWSSTNHPILILWSWANVACQAQAVTFDKTNRCYNILNRRLVSGRFPIGAQRGRCLRSVGVTEAIHLPGKRRHLLWREINCRARRPTRVGRKERGGAKKEIKRPLSGQRKSIGPDTGQSANLPLSWVAWFHYFANASKNTTHLL